MTTTHTTEARSMRKIPKQFRQGDILIVYVASLPKNAKAKDRDNDGRPLLWLVVGV